MLVHSSLGMTSMGPAMEGPEQIVSVDSDDESSQKIIRADKEQRFSATEESNESGSVAPGKTVGDSSRSQSQVKSNAESNADADDAEGAEDNGKQSERGDANGKGGAAGDGGPQAKRQKVEQQNEVPLLIPGSICKDSKASLLMHLRDEKLDLSGDTGAVGRIAVGGNKKKGRELTFDLKGQQFSGQIIPSATVLVVGVGRTEAKIEGIFSEVCRLDYKRNVLEAMGGEVLKGEMDESYRYEEEDVNVKGATDAGDRGTDEAGAKGVGGGGEGKTPKPGRKKTPAKKKLGSKGAKSSSGKGK